MMPFFKTIFTLSVISIILLVTGERAQAASNASLETYEKANAAYENSKYEQATQLYLKSLEEGQVSEELFYNLGNAYFKQQNHGEAALWYRRALVLNPRMPEPRQNLRTLKNLVGLLDFEPKGIDQTVSHFRKVELVSILTACIWLTLLCLASLLFIKRLRPWRSMLIIATCLFASLGAVFYFGLNIYRSRIAIDHRAVITSTNAIAQTSPVPDANTVTELPPGSEIRIVTDSGPWQYIDIPGKIRGWVKTEALTPLWPPDAPKSQEDTPK